ncbi:hypothetical protein D3C76_1597140 [compost metagenome]
MLLHHVNPFNQYAVFPGVSSDDAALLAFIFTCDDDDCIILLHMQLIVVGFFDFLQSWH